MKLYNGVTMREKQKRTMGVIWREVYRIRYNIEDFTDIDLNDQSYLFINNTFGIQEFSNIINGYIGGMDSHWSFILDPFTNILYINRPWCNECVYRIHFMEEGEEFNPTFRAIKLQVTNKEKVLNLIDVLKNGLSYKEYASNLLKWLVTDEEY